jgi:hypothetical protein
MGLFGVLALEKEAFLAREDGVAGLVAEEISTLVADDRGSNQRRNENPDIKPRFAGRPRRGRRHPGDEKHGIARQEETKKQTGLRENDGGDERHAAGVDKTLHICRVVKILDELERMHGRAPGYRVEGKG